MKANEFNAGKGPSNMPYRDKDDANLRVRVPLQLPISPYM